jgi:hypothetical protein
MAARYRYAIDKREKHNIRIPIKTLLPRKV